MATLPSQECRSAEDWQTTRETVRERTAFLFNNSLMSDIKFVVTDSTQFGRWRNELDHEAGDEAGLHGADQIVDDSQVELVISDDPDIRQIRVPVHKLVLAISSPVFQAMFYGDLAEKGNEIELPDTESEYLLEFLRFLYCDETNLTSDNVFGVLYLADKYIVPCLVAKCWSLIDADPSVCLKSSRAASTLDHDTLVSLLKRDSLCSKEFALFDAVKHWAEAKCKENGLEPSGKTMREILGEAVEFIRFPTMSLEDFAGKAVLSGILTSDEALQVHQYFARVIAAPDITFPTAYRAGLASEAELHEYCTYDEKVTLESVKGWRPEQGNLELVVESRNVHLRGVSMVTSLNENEVFEAMVRLQDENGHELATEAGHFRTKKLSTPIQGQQFYGFDVKFAVPVLLWRSSSYTIHTEVQRCSCILPTFNRVNRDPTSFVCVYFYDSFYFKFRGTSRQIFKLLFHKLD